MTGQRRMLPVQYFLGLAISTIELACSSGAAPPAREPEPAGVAVLFDLRTELEANVVAVSSSATWRSAITFGRESIDQVLAHHRDYTLLPSVAVGTSAAADGKLTGSVREQCYDLIAELTKPSPAYGFAALATKGPIRPQRLEPVAVRPEHIAAVANIIREVSHVEVEPVIERAYEMDLDGDQRRDVVLQATHPDLNESPTEYKPEYYSLLVVLPGSEAEQPAFEGYLQGSPDHDFFMVLALDAVADLDLDGTPELLVRARHPEGSQTRLFHYGGAQLSEVFHSVGGEGECPEEGQ